MTTRTDGVPRLSDAMSDLCYEADYLVDPDVKVTYLEDKSGVIVDWDRWHDFLKAVETWRAAR
jgi:hypothetical protein